MHNLDVEEDNAHIYTHTHTRTYTFKRKPTHAHRKRENPHRKREKTEKERETENGCECAVGGGGCKGYSTSMTLLSRQILGRDLGGLIILISSREMIDSSAARSAFSDSQ